MCGMCRTIKDELTLRWLLLLIVVLIALIVVWYVSMVVIEVWDILFCVVMSHAGMRCWKDMWKNSSEFGTV